MDYSAVIPTLGTRASLRATLSALAGQSLPPTEVVLSVPEGVALNGFERGREGWPPIRIVSVAGASAARQRNAGARAASAHLLLFIDDDIEPEPEACARLMEAFEKGVYAALSGRMRGAQHPRPQGLLRLYYRLQSGFDHPTWGAMAFGPAICTLPCWDHDPADDLGVVRSDWLPAGMLLAGKAGFEAVGGFPAFEGYSALEDVELTALLARRQPVGFHQSAWFSHHEQTSTGAAAPLQLARMRMAHRRRVASTVLGLKGWSLWWRMQLLRMFDTVALARQRGPGWLTEVRGSWAKLKN